jgi:HK97 family phage portal protein
MLLDKVLARSQALTLRSMVQFSTLLDGRQITDHKQAPFIWPAFRAGAPQWQITDFGSYVAEGFQLNTLIYSAIMYKVRSAYYAPLRAYTGDLDRPEALPLDHPLAVLCVRPNFYQSGAEFMGLNTVYLNISGNSFVMLDRPKRGAPPTALYPLRPDRVFIIPGMDKRSLKGYLYVPEGQSIYNGVPILPEDMMHVKLPNPGDPLEGLGYGLSPFAALARSADVDNAVTNYLKIFFQRGTAINTYLKFDIPMDDPTIDKVKARFMEIYGGYENWADVGVIDQGGEIKQFGMTFKEMGFAEIDERNESRILGPFGVPGILIGTRSGLARAINANAKELRAMFWEDTMLPELGLHEAEYQFYLRDDAGNFVMFDTTNVPALRKDIAAQVLAWAQLVELGVPKDTASLAVGLELGELPDGDVVYMPFNLVPMGAKKPTATVTNEPAVPDASGNAQQGKARQNKTGFTPEQKAALWKAHDRTAAKWEPKFADAAIKAFEHDKREVLALVSDAKQKAKAEKASIGWTDSLLSVQDYLAMGGEDNWRSTFAPVMQGVITDQGKRWAATLGMEFDVQNLFAQEWFDKYTLTFAQEINTTTKDELATMFQQAQHDGWSVPEMQKHLTTLFEQWSKGDIPPEDFEWYTSRMPPYRTEAIARSETIRSSNAGSQELFTEWGMQQHEWLSTKDDRTRTYDNTNGVADHAEANGQVVGIDEPFIVSDEKLMYPGDPNGSEGNTINCRCTVLPVIGE